MLFIILTLYSVVVMLNLLVAVISDTYARVQCEKTIYDYKQKMVMIIEVMEMQYVKKYGQFENDYKQDSQNFVDVGHLHLVKYYREEGESNQSDWSGHFNQTSSQLKKMQHDMNTRHEKQQETLNHKIESNRQELEQKIDQQNSKIDHITHQLDTLLALLKKQQ